MTMEKWNAFVDSTRAIPESLPIIDTVAINAIDERSDEPGFVAAPLADQLIHRPFATTLINALDAKVSLSLQVRNKLQRSDWLVTTTFGKKLLSPIVPR